VVFGLAADAATAQAGGWGLQPGGPGLPGGGE
jgi:hypothetical protein